MWGKMHGREEKAQVLQNGISCSEKNMRGFKQQIA
jgi:hypothetical protein